MLEQVHMVIFEDCELICVEISKYTEETETRSYPKYSATTELTAS